MNILLVGGSGFIGRHFVEAARSAGHDVTVVSRGQCPTGPSPFWIRGGIAALVADPAPLAAADIVCHFASTSVPATSNANPEADVLENLVPSLRLLETMRLVGARRILYLSSGGAIYGRPRYSPIDEDHPQRPISSYGITKGAMERYLSLYAENHDFRPLIIRPSNPYGPGQDGSRQFGIVATLLAVARSGGEATIFGDGSTVRDFLYIDDLCNLLVTAVESDLTGIYNCGSGEGASLIKVLNTVELVCGRSIPRNHRPARVMDPPAIVLDIARARRDFDWRPHISLEDGIRLTWSASGCGRAT